MNSKKALHLTKRAESTCHFSALKFSRRILWSRWRVGLLWSRSTAHYCVGLRVGARGSRRAGDGSGRTFDVVVELQLSFPRSFHNMYSAWAVTSTITAPILLVYFAFQNHHSSLQDSSLPGCVRGAPSTERFDRTRPKLTVWTALRYSKFILAGDEGHAQSNSCGTLFCLHLHIECDSSQAAMLID